MPPVMQSVFSTSVNRVGHDSATDELHVEWSNGRTSVYSGVPAEVANDVSTSWSVGKAVREQIIPNYKHRYGGG